MKLAGSDTCAMNPATMPPIPTPRFIVSALLRVGRVASRGRGEARDQRRLARPEARRAGALDRHQHERLPRRADERHQPEADALQHEARAQREARADPVDRGPANTPAVSCAAATTATTRPAVPRPNPRTSCR